MVVHAHPDDEVFGTGGVIAKTLARGDRVVVVYCTSGEEGEIHHPELSVEEAKPRLGELRRQEASEALRILGGAEPVFLNYRDSGMRDTEANQNPAAFMNAPLEEARDRLIDVIVRTRPDVMVTYGEDGGYGHPDHVMANRITRAAFERTSSEPWGPKKLYYSARSREGFKSYALGLQEIGLKIPWMKDDYNFDEYGVPNDEITALIDISAYAPLKKQALAVHRTQIPAEFFYLSIPDEGLARYSGVEYFQRIVPRPEPGEHESDLFEGIEDSEEAVA
jgi:LmbE family N-acetylglucosaminyl deacetylase